MSSAGGGRFSVAHVTTISDSLELLLGNQLRAIGEAGYAVTGVSAPGAPVERLEAMGIRHLAAPFIRSTALTPFGDLKLFANLVQLFRREKFTIVHTHTAKPDLYAAMAAKVAGVPIVVTTLHGFYFHDLMPPRTRMFYANLARLGMKFADAVLSQSPEDIDTARRERICAPDKISLLYNGIDVVRFDRNKLAPEAIARRRAELGIPADSVVVGYVGRLVAEKGLRELFTAVAALRARHPRLRLLLVGPFDEQKRDAISRATAAEFGIEDLCVFTGHRRDIPEHYALMDISVLPSHREGFPRTVMEASAMALPVVATDIRGCRTAVVDGVTGVLVPVRDADRLAGALHGLLEDPATRTRMGTAGERHAREKFDERTVFQTVTATYDRLLRERGFIRS